MKLKIITFLILTLGTYSCKNLFDKDYNTPLNTIENIKIKKVYNSITLTMEKYYAKDKEIIASFIYKEKKASIKLNFELSEKRVEFINIGKNSDYFLFAISELFEEDVRDAKMKEIVLFSIGRKGDSPRIDLFDKESQYVLEYQPNPNGKGSVSMRMKVDMESGTIEFWEKNGGIAKKNLVKAFEKI